MEVFYYMLNEPFYEEFYVIIFELRTICLIKTMTTKQNKTKNVSENNKLSQEYK